MTDITLYHNPRCSKSRQTLELLEQNGIHPTIRLYLESPLSKAELQGLLKALGISARELLRKNESAYKDMNLADTTLSEQDLIAAMISAPKLMERPVAVKGKVAVLGRPPENVLELLS